LRNRSQYDEITLLRAWQNWNEKSRNDYLEALLRLSPEERRKDRGASYGSIQEILYHILESHFWWFRDVPNGNQDYPTIVMGKQWSDRELRDLNRELDSVMHSIMDSLTPEELAKEYTVHGEAGGKPYTMTVNLADIIWHDIEEQIQHIGELNALFWQIDIDPPNHAWFSSELSEARAS
jgi:uncharacterized damage-inducible protein DinB